MQRWRFKRSEYHKIYYFEIEVETRLRFCRSCSRKGRWNGSLATIFADDRKSGSAGFIRPAVYLRRRLPGNPRVFSTAILQMGERRKRMPVDGRGAEVIGISTRFRTTWDGERSASVPGNGMPDLLYPSPGPISILRILFASRDRYVASRHCFPQRWDRTTHESIKKIGVSSATDITSNIFEKHVTISTFLSARLGPCRV